MEDDEDVETSDKDSDDLNTVAETEGDVHTQDLNFYAEENADETATSTDKVTSAESLPSFDKEIDLDLDNLAEKNQAGDSEAGLNLEQPASLDEQAIDDIKLDLDASAAPLDKIEESEANFDIDLDLGSTADSKEPDINEEKTVISTEKSEEDNSISFELDTPVGNNASEQITADKVELPDQNEEMDLSVDYPDKSDDSSKAETDKEIKETVPDIEMIQPDATSGPDKLPPTGLADINLDMDESLAAEDTSVPGGNDAHWQQIETKIDLAKAYIDMDDKDGAKEILEEVVREGDAAQQENAKNMLASL
jgi:pilus assembly protein FimV